jgi:hypothetical protein
MTRAIVCGSALLPAALVLGLDLVDEGAEIVLVDLADPQAVARAGAADPTVRRIVVPGGAAGDVLRALGTAGFATAPDRTAPAIGPLVAGAAPAPLPARTRVLLVTGLGGGCGRTTLAVELALRLATRGVLLIDLTGSGSAASQLGIEAGPWSDLEGLIDELAPEHLGVVAADRGGVRLIGGPGPRPTTALALRVTRAAVDAADLVIVDAPAVADERTVALLGLADRIIHVVPADARRDRAARAAPHGAWVIVSGGAGAPPGTFRSLPNDPGAFRRAGDGVPVGGALGRAYDELAEVIAIDSTE